MTHAKDTYKAARAAGKTTADACVATRQAHPELSFDQVSLDDGLAAAFGYAPSTRTVVQPGRWEERPAP
jgi:hypothetical protein